jgi:hypothetical protein
MARFASDSWPKLAEPPGASTPGRKQDGSMRAGAVFPEDEKKDRALGQILLI